MSGRRFKLDGLLAAVSKGVKLAEMHPLPAVGAGVARARKRVVTPKAARYVGFPAFCVRMGLPEPVAELRFHPERRFRFDFAWPDHRVYLEVNGGIFSNGRHNRGAALLNEWEKIGLASGLGWRPLFCQPSALMSGATIDFIRSAIAFSNNPTKTP